MDNYIIDPDTGCWIWQGYRDATGYTYHIVDGRFVAARRWHYEQRHGPIPDGLKLLPRCDNRLCVHPDHSEPASPREIGQRRPSNTLDAEKAQQIRELAGQIPQSVIAEQFGISATVVNHVLSGKLWGTGESTTAPVAYERRFGNLTFTDAERIRELALSMPKKDVAVMFGVSQPTISLIVSGKRWAKPHGAGVMTSDTASQPSKEEAPA